MQMPELDDLDIKILRLIEKNARMSYSDIGEQVGVSRVSVKKRMESLENRGVILGYETKIVKPKSPESITFFLDITTTIEKYDDVVNQIKSFSMIREVYTTTGECRMHCVGVALSSNRMQIFVNNLYRNTEGMKRLECHTVLSTIKNINGGVDDGTKCNEQESSGSD